jgi:hypothetical protein
MTVARRVLATLLPLAALALLATPASAAAGGASYLRLAHLSPDTPLVDVYVGSVGDPTESFVLAGVGYGAVSPYRPVPPGPYVISMRAAGASESSPPVISTTVDAGPGQAYTVAGTGLSAELGLSVLDDRLDMPDPGRASVRVINAAVSVPLVDCGQAGQEPWARDVAFGTSTGYAQVPLGTWNLEVAAAGRTATTLPVTLDTNSVYSVVLVDRDGGVSAELHRDSSGSALVPLGGVDTGLGGTAGAAGPLVTGLVAVLAVLCGLGTVAAVRGSRARP